jgi:hypothetical protein
MGTQTYMYSHVIRALASCSKEFGVDLTTDGARGRDALTLLNSDFAVEWPQPLPPYIKLVGPVMVEEIKPLPGDLQVYESPSYLLPYSLCDQL